MMSFARKTRALKSSQCKGDINSLGLEKRGAGLVFCFFFVVCGYSTFCHFEILVCLLSQDGRYMSQIRPMQGGKAIGLGSRVGPISSA